MFLITAMMKTQKPTTTTSDIWDISEIPIPGSPGERTFSVSPKPSQSNSTGSQNYGEEYKKSSRNVVNLESVYKIQTSYFANRPDPEVLQNHWASTDFRWPA
ncbi:uncharacterized protein [Argopecten irradians]|uniref:uncharacterized protein n=1 Tax=Argopecten irradians TaxID=31199 RepID=UPI00371DD726